MGSSGHAPTDSDWNGHLVDNEQQELFEGEDLCYSENIMLPVDFFGGGTPEDNIMDEDTPVAPFVELPTISGGSSVSSDHGSISGEMMPSTNLGQPMTPTSRSSNAEDQLAYFEKIKELQKYKDMLQRLVTDMGNGKKDMERSSKMRKILEVITNPNLRVPMEILLKCEVALKRIERQHSDKVGGVLNTSVASAQPEGQACPFQQIQDAVLSSLKTGSSSLTFLEKTFGQTVKALTGEPFATSPGLVDSEQGSSDNELSLDLPGVLRRELKIVDNRFKVRVIRQPESALNASATLHVLLMEPTLPRVPPLNIFIPHDYPEESPRLDLRAGYGPSKFLNSVASNLKSRYLNLPKRFTMLELLNCWEMSVRQVSNPNYKDNDTNSRCHPSASTSLAQAFL